MANKLLQGLLFQSSPFGRGDESYWLFPTSNIGLADDCCLFDSGKLIKNLLDLSRVNINSINQQHVLFPIGNEIIAVRIAVADVPRQEPIAAHDSGGF